MILEIFKKKAVDMQIYSPVNGVCISLDDVSDPVFSSRMMGDGVAFKFEGDTLYSPCDGTVMLVAKSKHAIGIKAKNGAEILIHVGLETVNLNGEGFEVLIEPNAKIKTGEPLLKCDLAFMKSKHIDLITPMILTNGNEVKAKVVSHDEVNKGESVIFICTE